MKAVTILALAVFCGFATEHHFPDWPCLFFLPATLFFVYHGIRAAYRFMSFQPNEW